MFINFFFENCLHEFFMPYAFTSKGYAAIPDHTSESLESGMTRWILKVSNYW
jgi:hypothetical protein